MSSPLTSKKYLSSDGNEPMRFCPLYAHIAAENTRNVSKVVSKMVSKIVRKSAHQFLVGEEVKPSSSNSETPEALSPYAA